MGEEPTTPEEWDDRARMAAARAAAGHPLDAIDTEALRRCPTPSRLAIGGYR